MRMEKITLLDTAVGSTNRGDELIMQCVEEEMEWLLKKYYVLRTPTHLRSFGVDENIGAFPDSAGEIYGSKYKFVCGTNLLSENMLHRTNQWNINIWNCKPLQGSILLGVGGGGVHINNYTRKLYKKILSEEYIHSVRTQVTCDMLIKMGFKCVNTGCVTMWKLTPDFCSTIPCKKSDTVIFTLTDYGQNSDIDREMIKMLRQKYSKIKFWIQGVHDLDYLLSLTDIEGITVVPSSIKEYEMALNDSVDYVGTRLHAGIFAMRHGVRSIILTIDNRMTAMENCIPNNCVPRGNMDELEAMIDGDVMTTSDLNWKAIAEWKEQFR